MSTEPLDPFLLRPGQALLVSLSCWQGSRSWWDGMGRDRMGWDETLLQGHPATLSLSQGEGSPSVWHLPCHLHPLPVSNLPPKWGGTPSVVCRVLWHSCGPHANAASPQARGEKHGTAWKLMAAGVAALVVNQDVGSHGSYSFSTCFTTTGLQAGGVQ